jgi:hypothetical protein
MLVTLILVLLYKTLTAPYYLYFGALTRSTHTEPFHITKRSLDPAQMAGIAVGVGVAARILILLAIMVVFPW